MKKLLIIFSIFTITTLPALALDIDFDAMRASINNSPISKYCIGGGSIDCTINANTGTYTLRCTQTRSDINETQMKADLEAFCNQRTKSNSQELEESASPSPASSTETMTVSGTVLDENNQPLAGAAISIRDTTKGTTADLNGKFELKNVPANAELEVSYVGHYDKKIKPGENQKIVMKPNAKIDDVVVVACDGDKANGIKSKTMIDDQCYPSACVEPRWKLSGTAKRAKCVEQKCDIKNGTGEWTADGDTWKCTLKTCKNGYDKNKNGDTCIEQLKTCSDAQIQQHPNATKTGLKKGTQACIAQECKCGFKLEGEKCVAWVKNEPCTADTKPALPRNAKSAIMKCDGEKSYCEIADCNNGYKVSNDKKSCISTRGDDCDATAVDPNATAGTNKNVKGKMTCVITDCAHGFAPNKDGTKCVAGELSESDSLAKIDELRDNADAMKDKEQSTANKLLGAAGIGATGIGGMQMASAIAEEKADADAERAMRAYLATFHCNYGAGKNIAGGETNVELPGGNELINLYSEYVNLANDLKARKTALDMRPGIESESILDAATSGLYDDVAIGKTSGAYTSLARALMDPTGADAAAWAAQKEETAKKKETGMITAGVGAAGSLIGNLAINSGKNQQNKVNEILNKYEKLKKPFKQAQEDFDEIPAKKCSEFTGTTGTGNAPDCECADTTNTRFFPDQGGCIACESGKVYDENNQCKCPLDKPREENGECKAQIPSCQLIGLTKPGECACIDNATAVSNTCTCNTNFIPSDGKCTPTEPQPTHLVSPIQISIRSDTAFNSGYSTLTSQGQSALATLTQQLQQNSEVLADGNYCIKITGHTDRVPFKKTARKTNQQLSEERANTIKTELLKNTLINANNIQTIGKGEAECTAETYPQANDERCRRVNVEFTSGTCQA